MSRCLVLCLVKAHFPTSLAAKFRPMKYKWKCYMRLLEGSLKAGEYTFSFPSLSIFWNLGVIAGALAAIMPLVRRVQCSRDDRKLVP